MTGGASALPPPLVAPRYGEAALADVLPSLLTALGLPDESNVLGLAPARAACLLLIDGLGWELLRAHPAEAPFLNSMAESAASRRLTAGFPTTTTTSLTSLGTGLAAGEHGMTGYQMRVPGTRRLLNALQWDAEAGPTPEEWQPYPTVLERASAAGAATTMIAPAEFAGTGLTRAALRGGRYVGVDDPGQYAGAVRTAFGGTRSDRPAMAYVYYGRLDRVGHTVGCASREWREELSRVDALAAEIQAAVPADVTFVVTADHGMVDVDPRRLIDVADEPALQVGVETFAGEARCRYLHTAPGATRDVIDIWCDELGESYAAVLSREEVVDLGLLGPVVRPAALDRVGDVVVLARGVGAVFHRRVDSRRIMSLVGQHGSLTPAEVYVPLLISEAG